MIETIGFSEGFHDAGICILSDTKIKFASHSERYSGIKNDKWLHNDLLKYLSCKECKTTTAYYEKPFLKNLRRLYAGQKRQKPRLKYDYNFSHHESHAAAGYYTSPFDDCNILVIDAIGEWDTISIWEGNKNKLKKIKSWKYPYSLGLLYSAITKRIGLKPNEDEYITMGMSAFGEPIYDLEYLLWENNIKGVGDIFTNARNEDLAASIQNLYEKEFFKLVEKCPKEYFLYRYILSLNTVMLTNLLKS